MKTPRVRLSLLLPALCLLAMPIAVQAQAGIPSKPPAGVPLRPVVGEGTPQPVPPAHTLSARWDERVQVQAVPLRNESSVAWEILGIQASSGIFVLDFPQKVAAGKEGTLAFIYRAADNSDGDRDLIRVLTDQGIKEVHIEVVREEAVTFATREVRWTAGAPAETKTVLLTVSPGTATPLKVRATGEHQAALTKVDATHWRVDITPASTARAGQFAVFIELDKPLLGKAPVILGVIQSKE